jgi:hypothetical protein
MTMMDRRWLSPPYPLIERVERDEMRSVSNPSPLLELEASGGDEDKATVQVQHSSLPP